VFFPKKGKLEEPPPFPSFDPNGYPFFALRDGAMTFFLRPSPIEEDTLSGNLCLSLFSQAEPFGTASPPSSLSRP